MSIEKGIYEHFKGGKYEVLALATHHDTEERIVIYQSLQDGKVYVREETMFSELVEKEGQKVPRFTRVSDSQQGELESRITLNMTKSTLQEWADKQGHDRCWYFPDIFGQLARILGITPEKTPELPSEEEFKAGCERYRLEQYGKT